MSVDMVCLSLFEKENDKLHVLHMKKNELKDFILNPKKKKKERHLNFSELLCVKP